MDRIDYALLEALQEDARASLAELGRKIGLSISATNERVKKLVVAGTVKGWFVRLDADRLGYPVLAFVSVSTDRPDSANGFIAAMKDLPEVQECHQVDGAWNFVLKVRARDVAHLEAMVARQIKAVPGVTGTQTTIVQRSPKDGQYIPCLPQAAAEAPALAQA
ncbi:MAG: Lrp/AsnC family transcriptional regulator [Rhodospirillales bacterium]|nr:Lrp/AsnC family transcriptional regulator [Rhodospirillales bacterium]